MYLKQYDYITGNILNQINEFDFGDLSSKQHCLKPLIFKAFSETDETISGLKIYLENKGLTGTQFGYYIDATFQSSIEAGSSKFSGNDSTSGHFIEMPGADSTSPNGVSIGWDTTSSHYVWLDTQSTGQGSSDATFRLFYNY